MNIDLPDRTVDGELVYENDFSSLDDIWWEGGTEVKADGNSLFVSTALDRGDSFDWVISVFLKPRFQGDLLVDYRAQSVHADCHLNFNFFIHTDMPDGRDLFETRAERTGNYSEYHELSNYLFTSLPAGDAEVEGETVMRQRMRRDPGFRLMKEVHSGTCEHFRWYRFRYLVKDGEVRIYVDEDPCESYAWRDPQPLTSGHIGFRSYCSMLEYRDLRVYQV
ncbi:DUF1961 family protein [Planctomycetota bacterium]